MALIYLTTFLIGLLLLAYYIEKQRRYWADRKIYEIKTPYLFGCMKQVLFLQKSFGDVFTDQYRHLREKKMKYGGTFVFTKPVLVVADPDIIKQILVSNFWSFHSHASYVNEKNEPLSVNLFDLEGEKWKNLRTKLNPAFSTSKIKMMFDTIKSCSTYMMDILDEYERNKKPIDVKDLLGRFTTDVIGNVAFGLNCNSLKNPDTEFRTFGKRVFDQGRTIFLKAGLLTVLPPKITNLLKIKLIHDDIENFFFKVVHETVKYREENNVVRPDFMQLLIQLKNKGEISDNDDATSETKLNMNELTAQAFVFFLGGFETAATATTMALYELGLNQDIQDKLRDEINKFDDEITYESVQQMKYLDRVMSETLRRHSPVHTLTRACVEDYKVTGSDLLIEKGTYIRIPIVGIQMDPEYYPEPEKFDPDRFLEENKAKRKACTYLPFGEGPRICIGMRFGVLESKICLIKILKKYKITVDKKTITPLQMDPNSLISSVKGGVWLNAEKI